MRPPIPQPPRPPEEPPDPQIQYIREDGTGGWAPVLVIALLILAALLSLYSCTTSFPMDQDTDVDIVGDIAGDGEAEVAEDTEDPGADYEDIRVDTQEDTEPDVDPCDYYPTWYRDQDMDGWGRDDLTACLPEAPEGYVERGGDCCDQRSEVNPGEDGWHVDTYSCPSESWDWNCDGLEERRWPTASTASCDPFCGTTCHTYTTEEECMSHVWWPEAPPACGGAVHANSCFWDGACGASAGAPTQTCR